MWVGGVFCVVAFSLTVARSGKRYQLRAPDQPGCFMDGKHMDFLHIGNGRNTDILNSQCFQNKHQKNKKKTFNLPISSGYIHSSLTQLKREILNPSSLSVRNIKDKSV